MLLSPLRQITKHNFRLKNLQFPLFTWTNFHFVSPLDIHDYPTSANESANPGLSPPQFSPLSTTNAATSSSHILTEGGSLELGSDR